MSIAREELRCRLESLAASLTSVSFKFAELASFGELTWHASERFDVTDGLRYAHSDQKIAALDSGAIDFPLRTEGVYPEGVTTWLAAISYRVAPEVMLYGRVATGSQLGGSNGVFPGIPPTVKPETITNYEVGVKSEFLDHAVAADLPLYYDELLDHRRLRLGAQRSLACPCWRRVSLGGSALGRIRRAQCLAWRRADHGSARLFAA